MTLSLFIDLGQTANLTVQQNKTNASNSRIIGVINNKNKVNTPIYLETRPTNNLFSVKILDENGIVSTSSSNYILTLHFEKLN